MVMDQRHQRGDVFTPVDAIRTGVEKGVCLVTTQFLSCACVLLTADQAEALADALLAAAKASRNTPR